MCAKLFEPTFSSLKKYKCPDWFRDAKFGIWGHWGPQSVPMYGDWYARNMYIEGSSQYLYHVRHYGHPSVFGYKDICRLWKAEKFDPDELMSLYYRAGARFFVAQAVHHDHFFNYPSKYGRFNSFNVGPEKDIVGLWKSAAQKFNMPFGLSEHLGASFSWWHVNKRCDKYGPYKGVPYDGNDPEYRDFYYDNYEHHDPDKDFAEWYTKNKEFRNYWLDVMKEIIDMYTPDLLYSDGALPFGDTDNPHGLRDEDFRHGLEAVSYLYNKSIKTHGENTAVYTQKDKHPDIYHVGILDVEKNQLPSISEDPWETDSCIGNWFYDVRQTFKRPGHIIEMLVDIISKNGTLLLNILQRPDGSIDDETRYILDELAKWFSVCSDGVYGTRPWKVYGEGPSSVYTGGTFEENKVDWTCDDVRFTKKGNIVYAFLMRVPESRIVTIKSFTPDEEIQSVRLLGFGQKLKFSQTFGMLACKLPQNLPTEYVNCLAIEVDYYFKEEEDEYAAH